METSPQGKQSSETLFVFVSLLTLLSLVVAQTVYEILAGNPDFLAVREVSGGQLLEIVAMFSLLPALGLFLIWAGLRWWSPWAARVFFCLVSSIFFFAFLLQVHNTYVVYSEAWMNFWLAVGVLRFTYLAWAPVALLLGLSYLRYEKTFRLFLWALSPAILLFPALFLWRAWPEAVAAEPVRAAQPAVKQPKEMPPIFILVLDEVSLPILLDESGNIDDWRFRNLRALAAESYWFRNATANADHTLLSVPVMLTGNYAHGAVASYRRYPNTLFTLLGPYYDIHAREVNTTLCDPRRFHCPEVEIAANRRELLRDAYLLYLARQLPKDTDIALPEMTRTWGPFYSNVEMMAARIKRYDEFIYWLPAVRAERTLVYFHELNPHSPYLLNTHGYIMEKRSPIQFEPKQAGNEELLARVRSYYLEQMVYTDQQVGGLVMRLKELGWYDKSLLIVVGDHGVSYSAESPGRFLHEGADPDLVLRIPLFMKLPGQTQGVVSDADVQHIDILPTVAALLGLEVPWPHAGRNAFGDNLEFRTRIVYDHMDGRHEYPSAPGARLSKTTEKLSADPK